MATERPKAIPMKTYAMLAALAVLCLGCDSPDKVLIDGSAVADSARRELLGHDFDAPFDPAGLRGVLVLPYPAGIERLQSALVSDGQGAPYGLNARSEDGHRQYEWILDFVRIGARPALLLSRALAYPEPIRGPITEEELAARMQHVWRIEDVALVPEFDAGDRIKLSGCWDPAREPVVGLGPYRQDLGTIRPVLAAWALDIHEARLVPTDPGDITCRSPFGPR